MFFFSSRRRHTRLQGDWSSDVCSSDLYRRRLLAGQPLALGVLDAAARAARWEQPAPAGLHRAMTFNVYTGRGESFQTFVALVMELRVVEGRVRLERAICAIDAGRVVNPGLVKANVEGGIGFADRKSTRLHSS